MNDKGVTTGEVQAHLAEIYGVQVSRDTISTITDRVLDSLAEFIELHRGRPRARVSPRSVRNHDF